MVVGMMTKTTTPSRQPTITTMSATIETVASARWKSSSLAFSVAVSP